MQMWCCGNAFSVVSHVLVHGVSLQQWRCELEDEQRIQASWTHHLFTFSASVILRALGEPYRKGGHSALNPICLFCNSSHSILLSSSLHPTWAYSFHIVFTSYVVILFYCNYGGRGYASIFIAVIEEGKLSPREVRLIPHWWNLKLI